MVPCGHVCFLLTTTCVSTCMDWDKKDGWKDGYFPPWWPSCTHPKRLLCVSPSHSKIQCCCIFRYQRRFLILMRPWLHICKAFSNTAIIISTDGFSMLTSISFPNYTVERSAVTHNQFNEFGRLDSIVAFSLFLHNNPLFRNMSTQWQRKSSAPEWGSFLLCTEWAHTA